MIPSKINISLRSSHSHCDNKLLHKKNKFNRPSMYNISYNRHHKKMHNIMNMKQNKLLETKIEESIVNNLCIKKFNHIDDCGDDIDTLFEDIDDLVVIINARVPPKDFWE